MTLTIRRAVDSDEAALAVLDRACWSLQTDVSPQSEPGQAFFGAWRRPEDVLVATDVAVVGWLKLAAPTPLASNSHVQQIQGLGVDPARRRAGIARALLAAGLDLARRRRARKVTLRVLGTNDPARRLYESAGFVVDGILTDEFFLGGRYVDDYLLATLLD